MPDKIFCGAGNVPKGQTRGNMKQCVEKNQVRYCGFKKIDPKLLETRGKKSKGESRDKIAIKMVGLRGKVSKLSKQIAEEKDKKVKAKLEKELVKAKANFKEVLALFNKLDKKRSQSRSTSRKGSRSKSSRSTSRGRKRSRRKASRSTSRKGSRAKSRRKASRNGSKKRRSRSRRRSRK